MITIENLIKRFNKSFELKIENLEINSGESFGLVGNNGAGKTTLFRLILDLLEPTEGSIYSKNKLVKGSDHWKIYTGSFLDENFLIEFLTVTEFFDFIKKLFNEYNRNDNNYLNLFNDFFNFEEYSEKYIRDLSSGNKKKVGIMSTLIGNPEVIILDEPFSNLDPTSQFRLKKALKKLQEEFKLTLIISSHDLNHITEVCKRIVVLEDGKIIQDRETTTETLKELENYFSSE